MFFYADEAVPEPSREFGTVKCVRNRRVSSSPSREFGSREESSDRHQNVLARLCELEAGLLHLLLKQPLQLHTDIEQ